MVETLTGSDKDHVLHKELGLAAAAYQELLDAVWAADVGLLGAAAASDAFVKIAGADRTSDLIVTPLPIVRAMVANLIPGVPVVDWGAGTGLLSIAAAELGFQVTAIEQQPAMAAFLKVLADRMGFGDRIRVVEDDALAWESKQEAQIISNPPYTRARALPAGAKLRLSKLVRQNGIELLGSAGLYAYFMALGWSTSWAVNSVFVVPTNWLFTRYGDALKEMILKDGETTIDLTVSPSRASPFKNASTTACVVTRRPTKDAAVLRLVGRKGLALNLLTLRDGQPVRSDTNWLSELADVGSTKGDTIEVGAFFGVHRGFATGANRIFILTEEQAAEFGLAVSELVPIRRKVRGSRESVGALLWSPTDPPSGASSVLIKRAKASGIDQRTLCHAREPWWSITPRYPTPSHFVQYMGRGRPAVERNQYGLAHLNGLHGLYAKPGVPEKFAERIGDYLESEEGGKALLAQARWYGDGLWKLEPVNVRRTRIPSDILEGAATL